MSAAARPHHHKVVRPTLSLRTSSMLGAITYGGLCGFESLVSSLITSWNGAAGGCECCSSSRSVAVREAGTPSLCLSLDDCSASIKLTMEVIVIIPTPVARSRKHCFQRSPLHATRPSSCECVGGIRSPAARRLRATSRNVPEVSPRVAPRALQFASGHRELPSPIALLLFREVGAKHPQFDSCP